MEFDYKDHQRLLQQTVRDVVKPFDGAYWREKDQKAEFPKEFEKVCTEAGFFGTMIPEEYGGVGLGVMEAVIILEGIANSIAGLDGCAVAHMGMFGINPVLKHGTKEQKDRYLPLAAEGKLHTCFGVTEPDAGTDTTRITTFARREGDSYVVNGRKVFISRAQEAEMALLLCRTTPYDEVEKKTQGMTLLFVPMDRSAISLREIRKMGRHAVDSNEMAIDDLRVPSSTRVGEEGRGFYCLLDGLNPERIQVAAEAVGVGFYVVSRAAEYANQRVVFGRPIGQNQGVQLPLADAYSMLRAAELQVLQAAWLYDNGRPCGAEANMAKLRATEAAHYAVNVAFETFGGYGFAQEFDIERFYRQLPLTRVAPVTNNLVKAYVAQHVLGLPKSY